MRPLLLSCCAVFLAFNLSSFSARADNLILNPGFEEGPHGYGLFLPSEAKAANCRFTVTTDAVHDGANAALMQSDDFARFGFQPTMTYPVASGEVYKIGVWVKAGPDFQVQPGTPGVTMRLNLTAASGTTSIGTGFLFAYLNNTVSQAATPDFAPLTVPAPAPADWTHMEAVVKMPPNVDHLAPSLFFWRAKGSLYVDDFSLEKVDPATPLSPPATAGTASATPAPTAAPAPPANSAPSLTLKPDHQDGVYALNESAVWTVDVTGDRSTYGAVPYVVRRDGGDVISTGTLDLSSGPATITATRAEPGALLAVVSTPDGPPSPNGTPRPRLWTGGALFAPEKIGAAIPAPADFDAFWKAKLKELDAIPPNAVVTQASVDDVKYNDGVQYFKVTLDNIWNTHVQGQLARPPGTKKCPGLLVFQAAGVGPLDKAMIVGFAKKGYLVLNIEAHDIPIDESPAFYTNLKNTTLKDYPSFGVDSRDTYYFLRMISGCVRAAEYLTSRPDWDGKILVVNGMSQGGMQSFATAALFPKVTAMTTNVPAGDDTQAVLANPPRPVAWPVSYFPKRPSDPDGSIARKTLAYFDTTYFAARDHVPTLATVGLVDETVRPASVLATYNAIPGNNKEIMIFPFYTHALAGTQPQFWKHLQDWLVALAAGQTVPPVPAPAPSPLATVLSGSALTPAATPAASAN